MASYDLVLFQTEADAQHFLQSFQRYCADAVVQENVGYCRVQWNSRQFLLQPRIHS